MIRDSEEAPGAVAVVDAVDQRWSSPELQIGKGRWPELLIGEEEWKMGSFDSLLTELENASLSDDLPQPIAKKLEENHAWFVNTLSMFKSPSAKSKEALNSSVVKIKDHSLKIKPELKEGLYFLS